MTSIEQSAAVSNRRLWTARAVIALVALFILFDGTIHLLRPAPVAQAFARLGYPLGASVGIGITELICLALYVYPRSSALGAILLTGILGGAISTHVRAGSPAFEAYVFPALMGLLIWGALFLRDDRIRTLIPVRR